jgi:hypothetical protein
MKSIAFVSSILVLLVAGCDSMNWQQYRIAGVTSASPDAAKLKSALKAVANQVGLKDRTEESLVQETLLFYTQPEVKHFRVDIGARFYHGDALVDLVAGFGPTPRAYMQAKQFLPSVLSAEFNSRLTIPRCPYYVPITKVKPGQTIAAPSQTGS